MSNINSKLFSVIISIMIVISCGERDISGPGNDGITLFDLRVKSIGLEVILNWDAIDNSDLIGYNIYRQFNEEGFSKYDSVLSEENSFTDFTVTADKKYEYYITAELTGSLESLPSDTVRIIPGLTTTWVLDVSTRILSELTHDVAHKTGKFFDNLPFVTAFDINDKNGYIYLLNGSANTLMLYVEGQTPSSLTNPDSTLTLFDDPSDIDYDSVRDDMWLADGSSGNIYHFSESELEPGEWVRADSLNTGGSADEGQIDTNIGDYWVVNKVGKSVEIYQNLSTGYRRKSIGGFSSGAIILALDENRARAYAVDVSTGTVSVITATGEETAISSINKTIAAAVEPESGDLWLLADDDEDDSYDLIKLSVIGGRILEINTGLRAPTWMGVNSYNMNVVVLNIAFDEPKAATFDKFGNNINTFDSLTEPVRARTVKLD